MTVGMICDCVSARVAHRSYHTEYGTVVPLCLVCACVRGVVPVYGCVCVCVVCVRVCAAVHLCGHPMATVT